MLSYQLTDSGFQIFDQGVLWVDQPFDPSKSGWQPYDSPEAAQAAAEAFIAERQPAA